MRTLVRTTPAGIDLAAALRLLEAAHRVPLETARAMRAAALGRLEHADRSLRPDGPRPTLPAWAASPLPTPLEHARAAVSDDVAWLQRALHDPARCEQEQLGAIVADLMVNLGVLVLAERAVRAPAGGERAEPDEQPGQGPGPGTGVGWPPATG